MASVIVSNENQDSLKTLLGKSPQPPDEKIMSSHPENAGRVCQKNRRHHVFSLNEYIQNGCATSLHSPMNSKQQAILEQLHLIPFHLDFVLKK